MSHNLIFELWLRFVFLALRSAFLSENKVDNLLVTWRAEVKISNILIFSRRIKISDQRACRLKKSKILSKASASSPVGERSRRKKWSSRTRWWKLQCHLSTTKSVWRWSGRTCSLSVKWCALAEITRTRAREILADRWFALKMENQFWEELRVLEPDAVELTNRESTSGNFSKFEKLKSTRKF